MVKDSARLWNVHGLNLLRARYVTHSFKRHMHDFFVIGIIEAGVQQFAYRNANHTTPTTGIIILNPGEPHTGEAAIASGFDYRAFYPEPELMQQITSEVKGRQQDIPFFGQPVIDDAALFQAISQMHRAFENDHIALEQESRLTWVLAQLISRHADTHPTFTPIHAERVEIKRLRRYIEEHYAEDIRLPDLAALVGWNPFYLLRVFRNEVGLPPHAYLEQVRIQRAQDFLRQGGAIANVAYQTGFSSQSHFTTSFRRVLGVTPGQFVKDLQL